MKLAMTLFGVALAVTGCKDKGAAEGSSGGSATAAKAGAGDKVASCMLAKMGTCREYSAANLVAGSDGLAQLCTVVEKTAVFAMTACPTDKLVGACTTDEHKDFYYPAYPSTVDELEKQCATGFLKGTFARGK